MLHPGMSPSRIRKTAAARDAMPPPTRKTLVLAGSDLTPRDLGVLVILIESEEAQELFTDLMALYPDNANSFPDYQPHTTLAYLKKGAADKYIEKFFDSFVDSPVPIKHIEFENNGDISVFDPNTAQVKKIITATDLLTKKEAAIEPKTAYQRWLAGE